MHYKLSRARAAHHKYCPAVTRFLLVCLGLAVASPNGWAATTVAGRTPGTFSISPTGAATYTIPIWSPPGPNGLGPQIALVYNSQSNYSYLGVGWSLSGLSSISRCSRTFAQDGTPADIALSTGDGYCMDGQRLRLVSGTYGADGSTYQTEVANFFNVTAHGSAGNGPAYFVAQDRNAKTYTYGNGGNSRVLASQSSTAVTWELNEVSDTAGNTMQIAYAAPSSYLVGTTVPTSISWTPSAHGSSSYNYEMTFSYEPTTTAIQAGYVAGNQEQLYNILFGIQVTSSGSTVKNYVFNYGTTATTGRLALSSVTECSDAAGSNCLLPTAMTYQAGAAGIANPTTASGSSTGVKFLTTVDVDGDGRSDLVYATVNGSGQYVWWVQFSTGSGFGAPVSTGAVTTTANVLLDDFDGKPGNELLAPKSGVWYAYKWNGSSFTATSTSVSVVSGVTYSSIDVDGDGLPDLVYLSPYTTSTSSTLNSNVQLNTTTGSTISFATTVVVNQVPGIGTTSCFAPYNPCPTISVVQQLGNNQYPYSSVRKFDFDGDGRQDLLAYIAVTSSGSTTYTVYPLLSRGTSAFASEFWETITSNPLTTAIQPLNWNDDGCTDLNIGTVVYTSACNGAAGSAVTLPYQPYLALDWNSDGRTDLIAQNGTQGTSYVYTSNGTTGFSTTTVYTNGGTIVLDIDGDGQDDWACPCGTSGAVLFGLHNGKGQIPDLLTEVIDGYGNSVSPTYVSLAENNYTQYSDASYPDKNYIGPMYVVSQATFSDPSSASGGTFNEQFWYYGAWTNLQGRGFEGMYATRTYDSRNGLYDYNYFQRNFPYSGTHNEEIVSNGSFYPSQWVGTLTYNELSSTQNQQRYFPYFSNVTGYRKEVGGSENGDLITTSSTNYTFDNYGNPTSIATTVTDNDPGSPYNGQTWTTTTTNTPDADTTHWCLGLFTESQIAYSSSVSGSGSVTRTKTFTPDTTYCRYTQIITEPNSPQFKVTEALGYDSFGNINSESNTGVGMGTASPATRTTLTSWTTGSATTGQFPMTVTNPSGAQIQLNYNFNYGLQSSLTDANNLTTSWAYSDGFGRLTQETRPDGTYTRYSYSNCANTNECLAGSNGLIVAYDVYGTSGTVTTFGSSYADPIERPLVILNVTLGGWYTRTDTRYDSLGRVSQRSFPCAYTTFTTSCSYWTANSYDVLNRLTQTQRPISSTNSNLQTTTYAYAGRTTTVTDPQSNARVTVADVNGWLRQTKDPMGYSVTMAYDAAGSKTKVTDSLGNTLWTGTYNYGLSAYLASATDMDRGSWSFTIDALGEETAWSDAKNQSFSETYDALSRPLTRTDPDLFTQWTWGSSATSHNIGKLQSECTGTGSSCSSSGYSESETYDSLGRRSQRTITLSGYSPFAYTWAYNSTTGLLNTLTYPTSTSGYALQLQYAYANGVLQSVTDVSDTPNVAVWTANSMDAAGHVTEETLGNGIVTNRSFDAVTLWLGTAQSGIGGGAGVKNLAFLYDEMGNVTQRQDNNLALTENIYYDNDYRFSYSKLNGTQNLSITYDGTGNITSRSDVAGGASWTYDPNHKHEVTQAGSSAYVYSYDANGNASSRQGGTISWSSYNYPTMINAGSGSTAETVAFSYGPDRQRWQQMYTGNSTQETTNYIGGLLEVVASGGVTDYRHYINVGGERVAVYSRKSSGTNAFSYLLFDHQASVASITNSSGSQVVGESFTAFGNRRNPTTWSGSPSNSDLTTIAGVTREGYTFQTALGLWMGLNHMNGRVEDSITGRILSGDPYIPDSTNPQSYNRYSYVINNPLSYVDPTGFDDLQTVVVTGSPVSGNGGPDLGAVGTQWSPGGSGPGSAGSNANAEGQAIDNANKKDQPPLQEVVVTASKWQPIDWHKLFVDWWPGASLGDCIYKAYTGEGCSSGRWVMAGIGAAPFAGAKIAQGARFAAKAGARFLVNSTGEVLDTQVAATWLTDTAAAGAAEANVAVNVTASEAEANLLSNGYSVVSSSDGATVLSNGENFYTIYTRASTGGPGMLFNNPATGTITKYTLSGS